MEEVNYDNCLFKWRRLITTIVSLSGGGLQLQRSQNISINGNLGNALNLKNEIRIVLNQHHVSLS